MKIFNQVSMLRFRSLKCICAKVSGLHVFLRRCTCEALATAYLSSKSANITIEGLGETTIVSVLN